MAQSGNCKTLAAHEEAQADALYWIKIDGCGYGLQWRGIPLRKSWTVLTTSRSLWLTLNRRCDRSHEHAECRGEAAVASAYYPKAMCLSILKGFEHQRRARENSLEKSVETYLLDIHEEKNLCDAVHPLEQPGAAGDPHHEEGHEHVLALSRKRLNLSTAPTGKRLEAVKQLMLRANLECPERKEASQPRPRPPAALGETPPIYEHLGGDVFEHEEPNGVKHKLLLWRDRGSGLTMIDHRLAAGSQRHKTS